MTQKTEKVEVDLTPVLATLEKLAIDSERIKKSGVRFNGQFLKIPKDFPVDFMGAAEAAVDYINRLPENDSDRKEFDVDKVNEGYRLLNSGEAQPFYL